MQPYYAGWLSLLPPILAITLALFTKEVITSLMVGILSGTFLYALGTGLNPLAGTVETAFAVMVDKADLYIIIFCCLLGSLVSVASLAGGSGAYGRWATSKIRSKRAALLSTSLLGILIFIDDYFNCLTVGTVMKPVTDKYRVSRAKLAYIIDSTAAPVCIIAPVSSWAAAVGSNLRSTGRFDSDFSAFLAAIPFNLYAILSLVMVGTMCLKDLDFGPMAEREAMARAGELGAVESPEEAGASASGRGTVADMLLPVGALIIFSVAGMLYNGGYWGADPAYRHSIGAAFGNCTAASALTWGCFGALAVSAALFLPRRLMTFQDFMRGVTDGIKTMVPACTILLLAWTISGVCRDLLQTAEFVKNAFGGSIPGELLPALIFVTAAFLSFSTGTAWGTFGILIPIVVPIAEAVAPALLVVSLSATLAGSVFGDHCSPISDTTILSSTGAGCPHMDHVSTQMPYAVLVASCCIAGYLVAGFTNANVWLTLGTGLFLLLAAIAFLHRRASGLKTGRGRTG
ncbi:Na+/H+ antiporter family protein [Caprobacter fermentans]|uniref:Na+/H+ antiporter family protein n=1 Tax=Caproicibacter fermentans TaxID=2576756 RepID=A0A6N8HWW8_9FIRM|nr:Na+/H+ antiporter NhaC family protein [Caproicibacter fermentans]MVB09997.1 Na+/H+ antiporter family protein [Caproicibacter fermentans]OCN02604.1 sodium:proton antiporter [Clostridium sp. W14A]